MFKKLFGRKEVPTETGTENPQPIAEQTRWVKAYDLQLSNMEDTPTYHLTHQLSIGSEIGNIVINDPTISPRHATFTLQQGVVSVTDHASVNGTSVNGHKIPPGKQLLLEDTDTVQIGDLEIKILVRNEKIYEQDVPPLPAAEAPKIELEKPKAESAKSIKPSAKKSYKKKKAFFAVRSYTASNALLRVSAMTGDFILAYVLLVLLMPFDDFRNLLDIIPQIAAELLNVEWSSLWGSIKADVGAPADMVEDLILFLSSTFHFFPCFLVFALLRIVSTLLFGVSISELMMGMRAGSNFIWSRIGGAIRVLVGLITGPFIIFDLPAIISKRTFKEVLTFTHIYTANKLQPFFGIVFYLPLLFALAIIAPLFQGLDLPNPIAISTKIEQRVKAEQAASIPEEATTSVQSTSQYLGLNLKYDATELTVFPSFKFQGEKKKLKLQGHMSLVLKQPEEWSVEFALLKNFDLRQLLGLAIRGNVFIYDRYPQLYEFVYSSPNANPAFRSEKNAKTNEVFAKEFIDLMKTSFELTPNNLMDVMQHRTPLIKGLMDFKSSFLALIEYKEFSELGFIKIGNVVFLRLTYSKVKPFDILMPLLAGEGKLYRVTFDKDRGKQNMAFANRLYKFALNDSDWLANKKGKALDVMTPLEVIDMFTVNFSAEALTLEKAQALYGYYYETSAAVLKSQSEIEYALWKNSVNAILQIIEAIKSPPVAEGAEDPRAKLIQNFRDLQQALENRNGEFFGVSNTTNV